MYYILFQPGSITEITDSGKSNFDGHFLSIKKNKKIKIVHKVNAFNFTKNN